MSKIAGSFGLTMRNKVSLAKGRGIKIKVFMWILSLVLVAGVSLVSVGCNSQPVVSDGRLVVAVSLVPQATFVEAVAGDLVEVVTMIPPGFSHANHAPSPREMRKFSGAALYFTIGVSAEEGLLRGALDINENLRIVDLATAVAEVYPDRNFALLANKQNTEEKGAETTGEVSCTCCFVPGGRDPHIWLSPKRVKIMIEVIARELSAIDPENESIYRKNAQVYLEKLAELDREIRSTLQNITNRTFIVYHPAFGYFADEYGLTMVALEKHGKRATARHLKDVIDLAREKDIRVILYQAEFDGRQARMIAEEIGGRTVQVAPLAADYIENLTRIAQIFAEILE